MRTSTLEATHWDVVRSCFFCPECAAAYQPETLDVLSGLPDEAELRQASFVRGDGCDACVGTGRQGRTGIHEIVPLTTKIRGMIRDGVPPADLRRAAVEAGMVAMRHDGARKAAAGVTTLEDVLRSTHGTE